MRETSGKFDIILPDMCYWSMPRWSSTGPHAVKKILARGSRCDDVHHRIPEAFEREDEGGHKIEGKIDAVGMGNGVYAVDT